MRKRIDYRRVGRQILIFLFILVLGLLNLKAQVVYSEDFAAVPNGTITSPKWELDLGHAIPEMFWVSGHQFECKYLKGEAIWRSSLIDISNLNGINASVMLSEKGQMDADDFIRVYYNVDGKGEVLFAENGNNEGSFGTVWARHSDISGNDLQIVIHVLNNQMNERHCFDNIKVEARTEAVTWTGKTDSLWDEPTNWSSELVPGQQEDVLISAGASVQPVISGAAHCKSITIERNASLTMQTGTSLSIAGDMRCAGDFSPGKGTVKFTGNQAQAIKSDKALSFHNLNVINHSEEGVTVQENNINVRNRLMLMDGVLHTRDTVQIINAAPDAVAGGSDSSYVAGKLKRRITMETGSYEFPVGMDEDFTYHPARIDVNGLEGTSSLTVSFEEHKRYMPNNLNTRTDEFSFDYYVAEGMWVINPDVEPRSGWYDIRLSVANVNGLVDNWFGILKRPRGADESAWTSKFGSESVFGGEGRKVADGYALKKYCTGFSDFTIGGGGKPIPIELLDFKADLKNGKVNLNWSTASEAENAFFTIEKSNGTDFKEVVKVNSAGNSATVQTYSAIDEKPFTGVSYYRLKQTDLNGKEEYSSMVSVKNMSEAQFILFPNPTEGSVKLKCNASLPQLDVVVYNQHGSVSYNKTFITQGTTSVVELQLKNELAPGVYYLQISTGGEDLMVQQIVIQ